MLPGVGIFGYDPTAKVLIQLLTHFGFEIHAIWTNNYDFDTNPNLLINSKYTNDYFFMIFFCCIYTHLFYSICIHYY